VRPRVVAHPARKTAPMPIVGTTTLVLALSLSADAFAASLGKGACLRKPGLGPALRVGTVFGLFQAAMPILGFLLGITIGGYVQAVDHWVAFLLLSALGGRMAWGAWRGREVDCASGIALGALLAAGLATSIDAFAVGIPLALMGAQILASALVIGLVTFLMSAGGVLVGGAVGPRLGRWAEAIGGLGLMALGTKILIEHTLLAA